MVENGVKLPLLSVHILLPENVDRRVARWAKKMPGASWPAWGGHITLVPNFVPRGTVEAVRAVIDHVCANAEPFTVRFGAPIAVQDTTRPEYFAVFLTIETVTEGARPPEADEQAIVPADVPENEPGQQLHILRQRLVDALEPLREDLRPQLIEQPFLPHVTLALGLGETEARAVVRDMRADPLVGEFKVEAVWLLAQTNGEGARLDRRAIPLGRVAAVELTR